MEKKLNYIEFQSEINARGITQLIHFTPTINLLSIYEQKQLLSRTLLESFDREQFDIFDYIEFTDEIRFDDKRYINLSVQHPNSILFSRFQQRTAQHSHITWCVLKIDPKYIFHRDTLFSITNAANSHNKRNIGVTDDINKFRMMFSPTLQVITSYGSKVFNRQNLKDKYPTDEQAEVLVKDNIPINDILQVCFKNSADLASGKAALIDYDTSKFVVDETVFSNSRL
ncbi:MAG: DUF4433 domain-containing protein [Cyclobacteriaceae bacterium]|nr:DUF4433 domain-containing protein [Cyclobacteriaceae bacterium]